MVPCVHAYVFSQGDYPLGVSHLILSWLCRDSGCSQISCEGSLNRTFLSLADVSSVLEGWQIRGRVVRKCCVNTFVSCGSVIRVKKIWVSAVWFCIYFLPLVCLCIPSSLLTYSYILLYCMRFYRAHSCLTAVSLFPWVFGWCIWSDMDEQPRWDFGVY